MTDIRYYCNECDGRNCTLTSNKLPKQSPETCPWSNIIGDFVYASWAQRKGPADIPKSKKEAKSDG